MREINRIFFLDLGWESEGFVYSMGFVGGVKVGRLFVGFIIVVLCLELVFFSGGLNFGRGFEIIFVFFIKRWGRIWFWS